VGVENVLCVLSTTSCFAPRAPDAVVEIASMCQELGIAHVINNAYGLQVADLERPFSCGHGRTSEGVLISLGSASAARSRTPSTRHVGPGG
jgi:hypothetical protein